MSTRLLTLALLSPFQKQLELRAVEVKALNDSRHPASLRKSFTYVHDRSLNTVVKQANLSRQWIEADALPLLPFLPQDTIASGASRDLTEAVILRANRRLEQLLLAPFHIFWSYVAFDKSITRFLNSYLRFCSRPFDHRNDNGHYLTTRAVHSLLFERVFRVYLRLSLRRESTMNFMTPEEYKQLTLQHVFDVPVLLDVCSLYYYANSQVVSNLVQDVFQSLPELQQELCNAIELMQQAFDDLWRSVAQPTLAKHSNSKAKRLQQESSDTLSFLTDSSFTFHCFLRAAPTVLKVIPVEQLQSLTESLWRCYHQTLVIVAADVEADGEKIALPLHMLATIASDIVKHRFLNSDTSRLHSLLSSLLELHEQYRPSLFIEKSNIQILPMLSIVDCHVNLQAVVSQMKLYAG